MEQVPRELPVTYAGSVVPFDVPSVILPVVDDPTIPLLNYTGRIIATVTTVLGTVPTALYTPSCLLFALTLGGKHCCAHFTEKETEVK